MPEKYQDLKHHAAVLKKRKKLGELLIDAGLIDQGILKDALVAQKVQKKKLGEVLVEMEVVDDIAIARAIASQLNIPFIRLKRARIPTAIIARVSPELAAKYELVPLKEENGHLVVAMANPLVPNAVKDIRFVTQLPVTTIVAPMNDIREALDRYYPKQDINATINAVGQDIYGMDYVPQVQETGKSDLDLANLAIQAPVIRFTNAILAEAIKIGASDVHIEPQKSDTGQANLTVRCRVDGMMRETMQTDRHVHPPLISRLKIISGLDISISLKPQDGKAQVKYGDKIFDLRVSTIPTTYGEKATIRILNPDTARMLPEDLGFADRDLKRVLEAIATPQGTLLVTGPTGSGKSSTLYAFLNRLNTPLVNIITVEDPVEFDVSGINQVQINTKAGTTFAAGLRSILRQDPDIIMVGEIRDGETAAIAFQAAQTGHLVLSTLHTNDAPSAVTRLIDLGVDEFQISSALLAVIGQRLVRRIHPDCKIPDSLTPHILERIQAALGHAEVSFFWKGAGCKNCLDSGYAGRMGIYEFLRITPALKEIITSNVSAHHIRQAAEKEGFLSLSQDGIRKARQGLTSIEEVFRVAPPVTVPVSPPGSALLANADGPATLSSKLAEDTPGRQANLSQMPPMTPNPSGSEASGTPKILIVDDSADMLALLRHMLSARPFTILSADNGQMAIQLAETEKPGLIITDYSMPGMDGMALIRALKAKESTRRIPIIMLTAKEELESEVAVIEAGADDYLIKPVKAKRLLARVGRFFIQQKKILIVDDNEDMRRLLRRLLATPGYRVAAAGNGKEALAFVAEEKYDLIITDFNMPEMDGMTLIRQLKSQDGTRHIPIIMLTAKEEVESEVAVIDAGADDYLTKPVNAERLKSRVKRIFRMHRISG